MRVQRHIKAFHGELLMTWQADILTRLIEVVYERSGWKMPGGITSSSHAGMDEAKVTLMYRTAARKIKKETLRRRFNLSVQYYLALIVGCLFSKHESVSLRARVRSMVDVAKGESRSNRSVQFLGKIVSLMLRSDCRRNN
ncbi:hypothetical protein BDV30DRAFT_203342 [Aspergillus minisclerotigenes]|uniref:Uncharacterized protein n=1 Tax=Aspergillus minisclerotigenes TaxID=656917 RepID=A0A5N6JJY1_9EURO|nr:hypothetical protein BDV30DRAFT_203342 [Aspergillus minisclerotigenes]